MIYITSDIHHQSLNTENQKHSDKTEMECAYDFFKILEKLNMNATYFISGKSFKEDWSSNLEEISYSRNIELGGHNYDCFEKEFYHRVCNKLLKSYNGTYSFQMNDCMKTKEAIFEKTNKEISSWRNHMYMHGKYTNEVLEKCGIKTCSDGVKKGSLSPDYRTKRYMNLPINIIPDHEHIYHAERTPEYVEKWIKRYNWKDDFGSKSYDIKDWGRIFLSQILENERKVQDSLLIIHPITMYLADNYKTITEVLLRLKDFEFSTINQYKINTGGLNVFC